VRGVTRDSSLKPLVADMARTATAMAGEDAVLVAPWGHTFWALAYAKGFEGLFPRADVVDHNADMAAFLRSGQTLVMPSDTLYVLGPEWWRERSRDAIIEEPEPGVIAVSSGSVSEGSQGGPSSSRDRGDLPELSGASSPAAHRVNDEIDLAASEVRWSPEPGSSDLELLVEWVARRRPRADYSVAVHLLDGGEVLAQADAVNPADGWSATSQWRAGDRVRDAYLMPNPDPRADTVRITMYRAKDGAFENGEWLEMPVPIRPQ
jgi:hypothetical protein